MSQGLESYLARVVARCTKRPTFTQGLEWLDPSSGQLLETSGLYGQSRLVHYLIDPTAEVWLELPAGPGSLSHRFPSNIFAEDLVRVDDGRILVLTWREGVVAALSKPGGAWTTYPYEDSEGWGIALVDGRIITSNGTSTLTLRRKPDLAPSRRVRVTIAGQVLAGINALAVCSQRPSRVWANILGSDVIVRIRLATGVVDLLLDCASLREGAGSRAQELNGIVEARGITEWQDCLIVTGKGWRSAYVIKQGRKVRVSDTERLLRSLPTTREQALRVN